MEPVTDTDRMAFLERLFARTEYGDGVVLRRSTSGRGWRLHNATSRGVGELGFKESLVRPTVREAIDAAMADDSAI